MIRTEQIVNRYIDLGPERPRTKKYIKGSNNNDACVYRTPNKKGL
jgi:hypothetical protein